MNVDECTLWVLGRMMEGVSQAKSPWSREMYPNRKYKENDYNEATNEK